ncbi:type I glutamate--ammonia ligase [Candidatus Heimdallarchaeota archaeon B3_Heim]|nr:MAG: type I glutamate--ammonia ligase [Candidatus Heimdallarchaeota archaeon B3_Heim]
MDLPKALELIEEKEVKELALQFTDLSGILHTLWVPTQAISQIMKDGIHTDGSSLSKMVDVSKSDVKLVPDLNSFVIFPPQLFDYNVARVVCDIYEPDSNVPFSLDPRYILRKVLTSLQDQLGPKVIGIASSEIEFFLFEEGEDQHLQLIDNAGYLASPPKDRGTQLRHNITEALRNIGIIIEKHHHEVPAGKSEFNVPYSEALQMVDTIYLIKFITKLMANRFGFIASFMPKPFHGEYGAGLHTHINLRDQEKELNLFSNSSENTKLSPLARNFLAGILIHAKGLALLTNPSVNSYKRLVPGWEAPVYISWANYNRSTLIRIPPGSKKAARLEYRPTDGSCNFYLAYAGLFSSGLNGVKLQLKPPTPVEENIYDMSTDERKKRGIKVLPGNLGEAIFEFSKDRFFEDVLGSKFVQKYVTLKMSEWKEFSVYVHKWERDRYIDV